MLLSHCLLANSIALSMYAPTSESITAAGVKINLENEYSPSRSSNRALDNDPNDLIHKFVEIHREETERVSRIYKSRQNVRYGESERESMDIYFKGEEANTPIFVYVHGGYWIALDKSSSGICVASLVDRGYRVIALDYNLCPSVTLEQLVQQMKKFLKTLLEYAAATNAGGISLCGHSAGAHLIAALMQPDCLEQPHSELIKALFLISGIYDLRELRLTDAGNPGNILSLDEDSAVKLSPMLYTFPEASKRIEIHILVAEHDSQTFRGQSEAFCEKLKAQGISAVCRVFAGYDHFTIIEDMRNDKSKITEYLLNVFDMS